MLWEFVNPKQIVNKACGLVKINKSRFKIFENGKILNISYMSCV